MPSCSPANREGLRLGEVDPRILSRGMLFIAVAQRISFTGFEYSSRASFDFREYIARIDVLTVRCSRTRRNASHSVNIRFSGLKGSTTPTVRPED